MLTIFVLQIAVPLGLLLWLALAPAPCVMGLSVQAAAIAVGLVALAIAGLWLFPPWWAPWLYALLFVLALALAARKSRRSMWWPSRPSGWGMFGIFLAFGAYASFEVARMVAGWWAPPQQHLDLRFPLAGGTFLVLNGGNDVRINAHLDILVASEPGRKTWRGTAYGVDLVAIDRIGLRAPGVQPADPTLYRSFGIPVLAPCDGSVVKATDGLPDMPVPEYDRANLAGNHVIIACGSVHVVMAHFRRGSVAVREGDSVSVGQQLAELGNSGGTDEPHLHIHAQRHGSPEMPFSGDPIPARFDGRFLVRNDRVSRTGALR